MNYRLITSISGFVIMSLLFTSCKKDLPCNCDENDNVPTIKVFATGLNSPRGLKFGPDGNLYVAEGGKGGNESTVGKCEQVPNVGPYLGSPTSGGISKISMGGVRTVVTDQLPSSQTNPQLGSLISGVADIAFVNKTLYAILAGAGCSHGVPSMPNSVLKVANDGSWNLLADLSAYQMAHPVANPEEDDFEPDGTWYSMINARGDLYAIEPNHGELVRINSNGTVKRIIDISASEGHIVPTALAYHNGYFYVGNLGEFPIMEGKSNVYRISMAGDIEKFATGFSDIVGLDFDKNGRLYVLENTTGNPFPTPGTGKILRVNKDGSKKELVTGLSLPTAMTFGEDGKIYVSNKGFGPGSIGGGEVLQITLHDCNCDCNNDDYSHYLPF